ncbi:MAG: hypothetical protein COS41_01730 [Elusimicrobia bacterium CG03_land_8_20_14_0_80_50_18]|nr:MAG: hypothetical protein COS41_01730 [Elusimicrobia bacterium CG03_land_8_20_14_0_80_50_18]
MRVTYKPKFERSAELLRNLIEASGLCEWFRQQMIDVSWLAPAQREAFARLAHYSTGIEGNPLTLPEVRALAEGGTIHGDEKAELEVTNYFAALRWIWARGRGEIREKDILKLHKILTGGLLSATESGAYKIKQNAVFSRGKIIFQPPPPEAAHILMSSLLSWVNSASARKEHPVIAAGIAHHRLVSIHPFMDGNGRIARALESWILFKGGFDTKHIFSLDEFFYHDRDRYYGEIEKVRRRNDNLTSWLEYVSAGILETLRNTRNRIQILRLKKPSRKIVLSPKQERILNILSQAPFMSGGDLSRALNISRSYLSKLLQPLVRAKLIVKEGSTKAASYRAR